MYNEYDNNALYRIKIPNIIRRYIYMVLLFIAYMVAGYWATGKTIYADKILVGTWNGIFMQRVIWGTLFGWALIPWALVKMFTS